MANSGFQLTIAVQRACRFLWPHGTIPLVPGIRLLPFSLTVLLAFWLIGHADVPLPTSVRSDDPNDYVQVRRGKFELAGRPFFIRGTNYFGSWRYRHTVDAGHGIEHYTEWALYHDWDSHSLDMDFQFMHSYLNATAVRIGTPAKVDFADLVQYHGYEPWFDSAGGVTEKYKSELMKMADIAYANGIRIQFCLLWNVGKEIANDPAGFKSGGEMDNFYANQVRSIAMALRNHPGVVSYSIGNEVLVDWPINGQHTSWYEGEAAGFILRRLQDLRAAAPRQLVTTDEIAKPAAAQWYTPGAEFALLSEVDGGRGLQSIRIADMVDYLGTHFYPETLTLDDIADGFSSKIADAKQQIAVYMETARKLGKPVSINEFGLKISPETLYPGQYTAPRNRFFQEIIVEAQKLGIQGLLAWDAVPDIALIPSQYVLKASKLNAFSPIEVDVSERNGTQRRVLLYHPEWSLFEWRNDSELPRATQAATAIASAWANTSPPNRTRAPPSNP